MKAQYLDIPSPCTFQVETCDGKGIRMGFGATFHIDSYLTKLKDTNVPADVKPTYSVKDIYEVYTILKDAR